MISTSPLRKVDLHTHTQFSAWRFRKMIRARDSIIEPERLLDLGRKRGLDWIVLTDHDTYGGCHYLQEKGFGGDFIPGMELETHLPDGPWIHIGLVNIDEDTAHQALSLRHNYFALLEWLRQEAIFFVLNHPLQSFRHALPSEENWREMFHSFPLWEGLNGGIGRHQNELTSTLAHHLIEHMTLGRTPPILLGGSDAHTPDRVAACWTEAEGETVEQCLRSMRDGCLSIHGDSQSFKGLVGTTYQVLWKHHKDLFRRPDLRQRDRWSNVAGTLSVLPLTLGGLPLALATATRLAQWYQKFAGKKSYSMVPIKSRSSR